MQIIITTAGRSALVNAQNIGTDPVLVTHIGVTEQGFTPSAEMTSLPGELKRLTTFAGQAVADDTIHVTIRDDSTDSYSMRGFGLYLQDGTLFAVYGQGEPIIEKSAQAMMLLAADIRFQQIDATLIEFGDTNWINPPATNDTPGVVELATPTEANTGTDSQRAVTPAGVKYVLDQRLGTGVPSTFAKGLLNAESAATFRAGLEIKSAALRDEGEGNGLNADLLDGQHGSYYRSWNNLTDKPSAFPPDTHAHPWAEITGAPATATRWPSWSEVSGKPSTFPPGAHTHSWSDISGAPATATRWPSWSEVSGKPSTFAPSSHSHSWSSITSKPGTTGSGNMVLANSPRFGGQPTIAAADQYVAWHNVDHTFTATLTGFTTTVRPTVQARRIGPGALVMLHLLTAATGTSNSAAMTLTGLPAGYAPGTGSVRLVPCFVINAGLTIIGMASVSVNGVITFYTSSGGGFSATGTKGLPAGWTVIYYT